MTPVDVYRIRGLSFQVRDGTLDAEIIRDVVENNHYASLLDQIEPRCICIDVGAHIGAFAILAASRGARVYAFEPIPVNYELLDYIFRREHGCRWTRLAWESRSYSSELRGTAQREGIAHCRGIKLDCEGSEFEILGSLALQDLQRFDVVTMEYHSLFGGVPALIGCLRQAGFVSRHYAVTENLGFIHAVSRPYLAVSNQNSIKQALVHLKQQQLRVAVQLEESPYTRVPLLGLLWKRLRRGAHELVVYYLGQMADQQNQINQDSIRALDALSNEIAFLRGVIAEDEPRKK
jgi:hypothetical protein